MGLLRANPGRALWGRRCLPGGGGGAGGGQGMPALGSLHAAGGAAVIGQNDPSGLLGLYLRAGTQETRQLAFL